MKPDPVEIISIALPILLEAVAVSLALAAAFVWIALSSVPA